jgi:hypothetical protein
VFTELSLAAPGRDLRVFRTNLSFISYLSTYLPSSATAIDPGPYCGGITVNSGVPFNMNAGRLHHDQ